MEALPLLWIVLATLVFLAVFLRKITRHTPFSPKLPIIVVRDPAVARRLLFNHADAFSNRPTTPFPLDFASVQGETNYSIGNMPYGPLWRTLRCSITSDVLHPTRLGLVEPLRREAVESLVARLSAHQHQSAAGGEVVVVRDSLRAAAYTVMARACFGCDGIDARDVHAIDRAQLEFLFAYKDAMETQRSRLPRLVYWRQWLRFDAAFNRLAEVLVPLIAARRRRRQQAPHPECGRGGGGFVPFVDSLLNLRVHDGGGDAADGRMLKETEMAPIVWEFIAAGAESVVSCVEWTLAHLVSQPDVQDKLHHEVAAAGGVVHEEHLRSTPYLRAVILECLRLHPTVPFVIRDVVGAHAAALAGATVPVPASGSTTTRFTLLVSSRHIGRNRNAWTDPDEFRPERFLAGGEGEGVGPLPGSKEIKMIPFGAGRRYCPGAGMGMLHIGCFLAALVREFEWAPPAAHQGGVDMTEVDMFFKLMKTPLRVRVTPRGRS